MTSIASPDPLELNVRREMAQSAPLAFHQLVVQITWTCTAACAMCYQASGPKGSDTFGRAALSVGDVRAAIKAAAAIPNLAPHFHLVGGEALIRMDDSLAIIAAARDAGFLEVSLTTNAFWAARVDHAARCAADLAAAGLTHMDVSWDQWRRPFIPPAAISTALEQATAHGIAAKLRLLTSRADRVEDALADLQPAAVAAAREVFSDTVAATGRARQAIPADRFHPHGDLTATCHRALRLTIAPSGEVYPCCSGLDQTRSLQFGNIHEAPLDRIALRMDASALLRRIVFEGIGSLLPILEAAGTAPSASPSSICSLCWSIFSDPAAVATLRASFPDERWAA